MRKAYIRPETQEVLIATQYQLMQLSGETVQVDKDEELDENLSRSLFEGNFDAFDLLKIGL